MNESNRVRDLEQRLQISENNLELARKMLQKTNEINIEKDMKIRYLEKKNKETHHLYSRQHSNFDANELRAIQSVDPGIKNDSTFILNVMRSLYKGNELIKLSKRNPTGKKYKGIKKQEITMEKRKIMKTDILIFFDLNYQHDQC